MKQISILLFLFSSSAYGQDLTDKLVNCIENQHSFYKLDSLFNESNKTLSDSDIEAFGDGFSSRINHQIIDSFYVKQITYKGVDKNNNYIGQNYNLLLEGDSIVYCKIEQEDSIKITKFHYGNEGRLTLFDSLYNANFYIHINHSEMFADEYLYGTDCGIGGLPPDKRIELQKLVKSKNIIKLNEWLSSPNLSLQIYAIDGFFQLYKSRYKLTERQTHMIELIKQRKGELWVCFGCMHEYETILNLTQEFNFE